jgi:hypothetical protein
LVTLGSPKGVQERRAGSVLADALQAVGELAIEALILNADGVIRVLPIPGPNPMTKNADNIAVSYFPKKASFTGIHGATSDSFVTVRSTVTVIEVHEGPVESLPTIFTRPGL